MLLLRLQQLRLVPPKVVIHLGVALVHAVLLVALVIVARSGARGAPRLLDAHRMHPLFVFR
jgi:hypothetical protein